MKGSYYRLKFVQNSSNFSYSKVAFVPFDAFKFQISNLVPNPSYGQLSISVLSGFDHPAWVRISNSLGKELWSNKILLSQGQSSHILDLQTLPTGSYFLNLTSGSFKDTKKFIKIK